MNTRAGLISRWFLFFFFCWGTFFVTGQQQTPAPLPHEPGVYPGRIVLAPEGPRQWEYRFVGAADSPHTPFFLPLDGPIILDTPVGTRSTYRVQFRKTDSHEPAEPVGYIIDRSAPQVPRPEIAPGLYTKPITVRPRRSIELTSETTSFRYRLRINGRTPENQTAFQPLRDENGIRLAGQSGGVVDYTVVVFATDAVGNRSGIGRWGYRIDRRDEPFPGLPLILSPVEGTFSNPQLLLVNRQGLRNLSVELTGPEGKQTVPYDGETLIEGNGDFSVTVRANRRDTGERVHQSVTWEQGNFHLDQLPPSGRYNDTVVVSPDEHGEALRYRLDDTEVRVNDDVLLQRLVFSPDVDAVRRVTLRTRSLTEQNAQRAETRHVYLLDGRRAPPPDIAIHDGKMILFSLAKTEIAYRVQSEPIENSVPRADPEGHDDPPDHVEGEVFSQYNGPIPLVDLPPGPLIVEARSRFTGADWGAVARLPVEHLETDDLPASPTPNVVVRGQTVVVSSNSGTPFVLGEREPTPGDAQGIAPVVEVRGTSRFEWRIPFGFRTTLQLGNVGSSDSMRELVVDNAPPAPPDIVVSRNRFRFETPADGDVRYRIGSGPFQAYTNGWIRLTGEPDARVDRRIEAYTVADEQISPRTERTVVLDARPVVIPPLEAHVTATTISDPDGASIPVDGEIITAEIPYTLAFANVHKDFEMYYEFAVGELPPLPTEASRRTTGQLTVAGVADGKQTVYVRVRGRFEGRDTWSPIRTYRVILDQEPPTPPVFVLPETDIETGESRVSIAFAEPEEAGVTVWFRTRGDDRFQRYRGRFDVVENARDGTETVLVEAFTEDRAGNRTYARPPRRIAFRERGVQPPLFTVNGQAIRDPVLLTTRESVIGISSEVTEAHEFTTMWRLYPLNAAEPPGFKPFETPTVTDLDTETVSYVGEAYRVNETGERSVITRLIVRVDPSDTAGIDAPEILRDDDGRSGTLYWSGVLDRDIYVSYPHQSSGFERVGETVAWRIPDNSPDITVLFFLVDEYGRRSETETLLIEARIRPAPPAFVGVQDDSVYSGPQTVRIDADGPVRYTVTTDGSEPPPVHPLSTQYDNPIELTAAPGEDRTYRIRARRADSSSENTAEATLTVRIDRDRPAAPRLENVESGTFFSDATELNFQPPDEGAIYYRLNSDNSPHTRRYEQHNDQTDIRIDAAPGELRSYVLEAYAVDEAGNRSQTVSKWELFVDREIVYVDPGRDALGSGTREDPFLDIDDALRVVRDSGRRTVFLAAGTHRLTPALLRDAIATAGKITIIGGYDGETWENSTQETILEVDPVESLVIQGDIRLQHLVFGTSVEEISVRNGTVNMHSVTASEVVFDRVTGGNGSSAEVTASVVGRIEVSGGDLLITDSRIETLFIRDSASVLMRDSAVAITGDRALGTDTADAPAGSPVPLVTVARSTLQLHRSSIGATAQRGAVVLLRATDASIEIADSYLAAAGNDLLYGISARRSEVTVQRSYLGLSGGTEQSGIVSGASSMFIADSMVANDVPGSLSNSFPARALHVTTVGNSPPRLQRVLLLRGHSDRGHGSAAPSTSAITRQARAGTDSEFAAIRLVNDALTDTRTVAVLGWDAFIDRGRSAGHWGQDVVESRASVYRLTDRSVIDPILRTPVADALFNGKKRANVLEKMTAMLSRVIPSARSDPR